MRGPVRRLHRRGRDLRRSRAERAAAARLRGRWPGARPRACLRRRARHPRGHGRARRSRPRDQRRRRSSHRDPSSLASELGREDLEPELPGEFRAGDIRHCLADTTRARELLGFEAETELADGLPELAEWVAGQTVTERGDEAVAEMRARNLVG